MTATPRRTAGGLRPYEARYIPKKDSGDLLEQYKLAAEMADRVSARRGNANRLFLSIQTTLLAGAGLAYTTLRDVAWYSVLGVALTGVAISAAWWRQLQSYRLPRAPRAATTFAAFAALPT